MLDLLGQIMILIESLENGFQWIIRGAIDIGESQRDTQCWRKASDTLLTKYFRLQPRCNGRRVMFFQSHMMFVDSYEVRLSYKLNRSD